ncbi:L,D-transpeptidase [Nocardia aurantia]|uniref:L,D-transpeptidase 1 n=1 Tax=Nocardia aurantia TaxID=2585199 RepID=A0A7K0E080_9NOCA|nr:L,D-transpeptidase [Nocardia aurantia]MQY31469.1 L,D-transpeptidase 1 [Nocardia aurantia]
MRNTMRNLFLATVIAAFATIVPGTATATVPISSQTASSLTSLSAASLTTPAAAYPVASISPADGSTVGVAAPVTIRFTDAVGDRARAEKSVSVAAAGVLPGEFTWNSDREVVWRPTGGLPAASQVTVTVGTTHSRLETDGGIAADADLSAHTFTVFMPGEPPRVMPASMGRPGRETPVGIFPVLEKFRTVEFDSRTIGIPLSDPDGYLITGEFAERLTWDGVFVHSAPWSVDEQGNQNVSHGCINLAPDDAAWYYSNVNIGDLVTSHW